MSDEGTDAPGVQTKAVPEDTAVSSDASMSQRILALVGHRSGVRRAPWFERYAGLGLLAVLILVFSLVLPDTFPTYDHPIGIVSNQTITGVVALGLLMPLSAGAFDISI